MTIQIDLWQLVTALGGLLLLGLTFLFGAGKVLLGQVAKQLDARFTAIDSRFSAIEATNADVQELEKAFLRWQADLPLHYVRREDYVRNQTVIEAKLDAIKTEITMLLREGALHEHRPTR